MEAAALKAMYVDTCPTEYAVLLEGCDPIILYSFLDSQN